MGCIWRWKYALLSTCRWEICRQATSPSDDRWRCSANTPNPSQCCERCSCTFPPSDPQSQRHQPVAIVNVRLCFSRMLNTCSMPAASADHIPAYCTKLLQSLLSIRLQFCRGRHDSCRNPPPGREADSQRIF